MSLPPIDTSDRDAEQLRMLAIGFRIVGGLCAFCVNIFWLHFYAALVFATQPAAWKPNPPPSFVLLLMPVLVVVFILFGYALGLCGFLAARNLDSRKGWTFCFVTSILYLFAQPLGTVLGVLSLIVLLRPSVKARLGTRS